MGALPCGFESRLSYHFINMTSIDVCSNLELWNKFTEEEELFYSMTLEERLEFLETLLHYETED